MFQSFATLKARQQAQREADYKFWAQVKTAHREGRLNLCYKSTCLHPKGACPGYTLLGYDAQTDTTWPYSEEKQRDLIKEKARRREEALEEMQRLQEKARAKLARQYL